MESEYSQYSHMYYVKLAPGLLRRLRKQKGLTQKELAKKAGVAASTIVLWESGRGTCSKRYIAPLAQALECTTEALTANAKNVTISRRISGKYSAPLPKANAIHLHRELCGLSVKDLAQKMGTTTNTINLWENGKVVPPTQKTLLLAQTLGCSVAELAIPGTFDFDFKYFAYNLQRLRTARGLSRVELDALLHNATHMTTVYLWENGKRQPSFAKLNRIVDALGCTLDDLQQRPPTGSVPRHVIVGTARLAPSKLMQMRKKLGLSRRKLAARLGVSYMSISNWERNSVRPSPASMQKLCDFFHCSPDDLFITPSKSEEKS